MTDTRPTLADAVNELTRPITHHERYQVARTNRDGSTTWMVRHHRTDHPSLIDQLASAMEQSGTTEEGARPGYTSKPSARLEAIDVLLRIDQYASRHDHHLTGRKPDVDDPTTVVVQRVHTNLTRLEPCHRGGRCGDCCLRHTIEHEIYSWWLQARIVTGWDSPAWRPDNTCPLCGKRGGLRVRLGVQAATCVECHEVWDETTILLLAAHIRAENTEQPEEDTPTQAAS